MSCNPQGSNLKFAPKLQITFREESSLERLSLETSSQTSFLGSWHISVNSNRTIPICVALVHDLINRSNDLQNTPCQQWKGSDGHFELFALELVVLIGVEVFRSALYDVWAGGTGRVLVACSVCSAFLCLDGGCGSKDDCKDEEDAGLDG